MSPQESRVGTSPTRVRIFTQDKLSPNAAAEKWDIVKIVCTQPFNKVRITKDIFPSRTALNTIFCMMQLRLEFDRSDLISSALIVALRASLITFHKGWVSLWN